jgi:hypothetical protein
MDHQPLTRLCLNYYASPSSIFPYITFQLTSNSVNKTICTDIHVITRASEKRFAFVYIT